MQRIKLIDHSLRKDVLKDLMSFKWLVRKQVIISAALTVMIGVAWFVFYYHYNNLTSRYVFIYDDTNPGFIYSDGWQALANDKASSGFCHVSHQIGATATYFFSQDTSEIVLLFPVGPEYGTLTVSIDGKVVGSIDQHAQKAAWGREWRSEKMVPAGVRSLTLTHRSGDRVAFDAFIVDTTKANEGLYIQWGIKRWIVVWLLLLLLAVGFPAMKTAREKHQLSGVGIVERTQTMPQSRAKISALGLAVICVLLIAWQSTFALAGTKLDRLYTLNPYPDGISKMPWYFYFYYHLGLFPVVIPNTEILSKIVSPEDALLVIQNHGTELTNWLSNEIATGDFGRIWLFLPSAALRGDTQFFSAGYFNQWLFLLALLGILIACWWIDRFALGIFLVAFLGSHSFQLYQLYIESNQVFSLPISIALLLLSLHIPLIFEEGASKVYPLVLAVIAGSIIGTAIHIRAEIAGIILSFPFIYLLATHLKWRQRLTMVLLLILSFWLVRSAWTSYFSHKFDQAIAFVREQGGTPWTGPRRYTHDLWTVLWGGLGDYDTKYGYAFADSALYHYLEKVLVTYPLAEEEQQIARQTQHLTLHPKYITAVRDKVLGDIFKDPLWYLDILAKRFWRIQVEVTPVMLAIGAHRVTLPFSGALLIPVILALLLVRQWPYVKLLLFSLPLASVAFFAFSGWKNTYYSIFLQIIAAIFCVILWDTLVHLFQFLKPPHGRE